MSSSFDSLLADASQLPVPERLDLVEAIWNTVPAESLPPLSEEWLTEIRRRSAQYDSGSVGTIPWEQVRADALRRVGIVESHANG